VHLYSIIINIICFVVPVIVRTMPVTMESDSSSCEDDMTGEAAGTYYDIFSEGFFVCLLCLFGQSLHCFV